MKKGKFKINKKINKMKEIVKKEDNKTIVDIKKKQKVNKYTQKFKIKIHYITKNYIYKRKRIQIK